MVHFCLIVITTCYRSIIQCREHIASYVANLCGIVTQAFQHILHRMKIYLLQSAPNNIIREVLLSNNHLLHIELMFCIAIKFHTKRGHLLNFFRKCPLSNTIFDFTLLVQLRTCRDSVIYHQKVQSLMTIFLVYC